MNCARLIPLLCCLAGSPVSAELNLQKNDTLLYYGNSMVERLLEQGEMEGLMQLALPEKKLRFRSLAWTGDEVGNRLRAEGYAGHLKDLIKAWPAQVVVVGYGMNEAFAGPAGLPAFRQQLADYLGQLQRLHPGAKLVLLAPTAVDRSPQPGAPDAAARNAVVALYAGAIADAAKASGALYVDLFNASREAYAKSTVPLTTNGLHLNDAGNRAMARVIATALAGESAVGNVSAERLREVAPAAGQLAHFVEEMVRPKNGVLYYGVRKRPEERAAEMPLYFQRVEKAEAIVHEIASRADARFAAFPAVSLPVPPPTGGAGSNGDVGVVRNAAEAQAEFKVADGYSVNLFASDEQFPELRAPVQIAFDARGRLWVVTMPSFPHTLPGQPREDKLLVLEDTDRDGRADTATTFAGGMDALDGIAFSEDGVVVSEQPRHWLMQDTDGDGRADTRRELLRGVDVTDSHHGGMIAADPAGAIWFCDGVFHRSQFETPFGPHRIVDSTTCRHNLRTGRIETEWQSITPNPWKVTFDRWGNTYQMYGDGVVLDGLGLTWTPLGVYHPFNHSNLLGYGKGSAAMSISSPNFPAEYQQGMASAALLGSHAISITKVDFTHGKAHGSDQEILVSSPNAAFRPADLAFGFDGALYASDFCSTIIGHAQNPMRDPRWNHTKGRIWRIVNTAGPVAKAWPKIEGASPAELAELLTHSQDIVRHHVRIALRRAGAAGLAAAEARVAKLGSREASLDYDQAVLETLFVAEGLGETRPALLGVLLKSPVPEYRGAAVHMARLQADRLSDIASILSSMATDAHPRVRMEVIDAVAHLRPAFPNVETAITGIVATEAAVKQMLADLSHGTQPRLAASVPVLEIAPETELRQWHNAGKGVRRTFVSADAARHALLALKSGFVKVSLNGVEVFEAASQWSSDHQVPLELVPGLNVLELSFRNAGDRGSQVYLFDGTGQRPAGVAVPSDAASFAALRSAFDQTVAAQGEILRLQATGGMQFSPQELHAAAGTRVRLVFENPDLLVHNFALCAPGSVEEIGAMADQLAATPDGVKRNYIPDSPKILAHTGLVAPKSRAEITFVTPKVPGHYPYLCTFPGHWRIMKGVLIIDAPFTTGSRTSDELDAFESEIPREALKIASAADHTSNAGGGRDASALFNGTVLNAAGEAGTSDDGRTFRGYGQGDFLTVKLDTAGHPQGFDLTAITTVTAHGDSRASQKYRVSVALAGSPEKFLPLAEAKVDCTGGSAIIRLKNPAGGVLENGELKARGVVALRFDFENGPVGYSVFREISLSGSPTAAK